jgi:outer membrane murein-binding lipoprotein Lpp
MRTIIGAVLLIGLVAAGCASPERIAEGARRHSDAAEVARMQGDHNRAFNEQGAANRQWAKACDRAHVVYGANSHAALAYCSYPR